MPSLHCRSQAALFPRWALRALWAPSRLPWAQQEHGLTQRARVLARIPPASWHSMPASCIPPAFWHSMPASWHCLLAYCTLSASQQGMLASCIRILHPSCIPAQRASIPHPSRILHPSGVPARRACIPAQPLQPTQPNGSSCGSRAHPRGAAHPPSAAPGRAAAPGTDPHRPPPERCRSVASPPLSFGHSRAGAQGASVKPGLFSRSQEGAALSRACCTDLSLEQDRAEPYNQDSAEPPKPL